MPTRCLIVDDNDAFLGAARGLLERQGMSVAGVASTGAEAVHEADALRPEVVLVDVSLRGESGLDVARELVRGHLDPEAVVILISTHAREDLAELIDGCPAAAFLPKAELSADAIRRIIDGRSP